MQRCANRQTWAASTRFSWEMPPATSFSTCMTRSSTFASRWTFWNERLGTAAGHTTSIKPPRFPWNYWHISSLKEDTEATSTFGLLCRWWMSLKTYMETWPWWTHEIVEQSSSICCMPIQVLRPTNARGVESHSGSVSWGQKRKLLWYMNSGTATNWRTLILPSSILSWSPRELAHFTAKKSLRPSRSIYHTWCNVIFCSIRNAWSPIWFLISSWGPTQMILAAKKRTTIWSWELVFIMIANSPMRGSVSVQF